MGFHEPAAEAIRVLVRRAGFEQMGSSSLFRFTALTVNSPLPQHNVFISVEPEGIEVMAPIGALDDYSPSDLELARNPHDGYRIEPAGSSLMALVRSLDDDAVRSNPQHMFDAASDLAEYAGFVEHALERNRARKFELAESVGRAVTDPDHFETSRQTPSQLADDLEEVLRLIPVEGFWKETMGYVLNSHMVWWGSHSGPLRDSPWHPSLDRAEAIGNARGWTLD